MDRDKTNSSFERVLLNISGSWLDGIFHSENVTFMCSQFWRLLPLWNTETVTAEGLTYQLFLVCKVKKADEGRRAFWYPEVT